MATNRLILGVRGERSPPCGKTDGGQPRSPRRPFTPFALFVFFTLSCSFGVAYVLTKLMNPPLRVPFVSSPVYPLQNIGAVAHAGKGNEGGDSFYRTIIDNNIFRPLGWTPPRPVEPYRLIGTLLPRDANIPAQAVIESTGKAISIVSAGETLDTETKVVSIESKSVVLESRGVRRTLRLSDVF